MTVVLCMALTFGTATLLPYAWAQYAGVLLFGQTRTVRCTLTVPAHTHRPTRRCAALRPDAHRAGG